ncbi:MAG: CBS domain-containing protein [Myxococcota bacterium]
MSATTTFFQRTLTQRSGVHARDVMVKRVYTVTPDQRVYEAVNILLKRRISGMPVVDNERRVVGVISERDGIQALMRAVHDRTPPSTVGDVMTPNPKTITADTHLMTIAHRFLTDNIRRLPVVDAEGRLVGQVSRRDLLAGAMRIFDKAPNRDAAILYLSALNRDRPV